MLGSGPSMTEERFVDPWVWERQERLSGAGLDSLA